MAIAIVGPARVDVGLGQTNIKANGHRYTSPCEGLDPYKNLTVTAQILAEQKAKGGVGSMQLVDTTALQVEPRGTIPWLFRKAPQPCHRHQFPGDDSMTKNLLSPSGHYVYCLWPSLPLYLAFSTCHRALTQRS